MSKTLKNVGKNMKIITYGCEIGIAGIKMLLNVVFK